MNHGVAMSIGLIADVIASNLLLCWVCHITEPFRICIWTLLCLSVNWHLIIFVWNVSLRLEEWISRAFFLTLGWKPELQSKLWTGQVCDLSGVLGRIFPSGLVNKGYILGTRPSVTLTKEEPNTQRSSFIARHPFILVLLTQRKWDGSRSEDLGNPAFPVLDVCWRGCIISI